MWWLAVPIVVAVGKVIYDAVTEDEDHYVPNKTILESNLERLGFLLHGKESEKIAVIGQPGAGKSSLLIKMSHKKIVPLPVVGSQTDATDWSQEESCNLISEYNNYVFVDVPGYDTISHPVNVFISMFPFHHIDKYIFVINGKLHGADEELFKVASRENKPICVARSFLDSLEFEDVSTIENDIRERLDIREAVPIFFFSNRNGKGVKEIYSFVEA